MGTFRFSLQPALDVAASRERDAGVVALRALALVDEARAALNVLDVRERELCAQARLLQSIAMPASQWIATEFFAARLRDVRSSRDRALRAATSERGAARAALACARNGRIALDTLRARRLAEHSALQEQREAAELDESNAARSRRTEEV